MTTGSFPHDNFSSVYWIFNKLGHMIPLWKGKNPIYFGVITIITFVYLYRQVYFVMHTFLVSIAFLWRIPFWDKSTYLLHRNENLNLLVWIKFFNLFFVVLNKNWKMYRSKQSLLVFGQRTNAHREDCYIKDMKEPEPIILNFYITSDFDEVFFNILFIYIKQIWPSSYEF